jgi:predicted nucleic acid-binding protein
VPTATLDTNVLLRLLLKDVPSQFERDNRILGEAEADFAVPDIVFMELMFALDHHYGFTRAQIAEVVRGAMAIPRLVCSDQLIGAALDIYLVQAALSFEDCYLAEYARKFGFEPLWTFDRALANHSPWAREVP